MSQEQNDAEHLQHFVATSTKEQELIVEFVRITAEYERMARELEASGIPQRRAEIVLTLINSGAKKRTYYQVGRMLQGLSTARVGQILKAGRRRAARLDPFNKAQDAA